MSVPQLRAGRDAGIRPARKYFFEFGAGGECECKTTAQRGTIMRFPWRPLGRKKRRLFLGAILRRVAVMTNAAEDERDSDRFEKVAEKTVHLSEY